MDDNGFFWRIQRGELPLPNIAATFGTRFVDVQPEVGEITATFEIGEQFLNPVGIVQGGILAAMLDDTMGPALAATLGAGEFAPTLNLNVSFVRPAAAGSFTGKGRVVARGGRICHLQGELFDEAGTLVATASATAMVSRST